MFKTFQYDRSLYYQISQSTSHPEKKKKFYSYPLQILNIYET